MDISPDTDPLLRLDESVELVRRARMGDRPALDALLRRYMPRVARIVRIRMGTQLRRNVELEDIVQETMWVAAQHIDEFEPRDHASIIQWLTRIAQNRILDAARYWSAVKRNPTQESSAVETGSALALTALARDPTPSSVVGRAEAQERYDRCVQALPEPARELVLLRDYGELSWEEITERTKHGNAHAAQQAYRRAQIKLAERLALDSEGE